MKSRIHPFGKTRNMFKPESSCLEEKDKLGICVGYWKLNAVTVFNMIPLPLIMLQFWTQWWAMTPIVFWMDSTATTWSGWNQRIK